MEEELLFLCKELEMTYRKIEHFNQMGYIADDLKKEADEKEKEIRNKLFECEEMLTVDKEIIDMFKDKINIIKLIFL